MRARALTSSPWSMAVAAEDDGGTTPAEVRVRVRVRIRVRVRVRVGVRVRVRVTSKRPS